MTQSHSSVASEWNFKEPNAHLPSVVCRPFLALPIMPLPMRNTVMALLTPLLLLIVPTLGALLDSARFALQVQEAGRTSELLKVPVTLGVMSRCPDALLCESVFDKVLAQVDDKVTMSLTFIGK